MCECLDYEDGSLHVCEACGPDVNNLRRCVEWLGDRARDKSGGEIRLGVNSAGEWSVLSSRGPDWKFGFGCRFTGFSPEEVVEAFLVAQAEQRVYPQMEGEV